MSTESDYIKVLTIKGANGEERTMKFPMKLDLERPKRPRTTFSEQQLAQLEEAFKSSGYLTGPARAELAVRLGLSDTQVKVWFQNRRTKDRRKTPTEQSASSSTPQYTPSTTVHSSIAPSLSFNLQYPLMYPAPMLPSNLFYANPFANCAQY